MILINLSQNLIVMFYYFAFNQTYAKSSVFCFTFLPLCTLDASSQKRLFCTINGESGIVDGNQRTSIDGFTDSNIATDSSCFGA
jgi:hypothetical protein